MDKVNEFEHGGRSGGYSDDIVSNILNDENANTHYRFPESKPLIDNLDEVKSMIEHHIKYQVPRLRILNDYFLGKNSYIYNVKRRIDEEKADHRISHNFAKYISQFVQGYLVGNPVKISHDDDEMDENIHYINSINDINSINEDIVLDMSKFGRAYELVMRNGQDEDKVFLSDVMGTFVIYSNTIDKRPIGAVRYVRRTDKDGATLITPSLYTDDTVYRFKEVGIDNIRLIEDRSFNHDHGEVPITEYMNNRFRQGDYENVISLIDAYDSAESDTANYMTDLNDALLVVVGNVKMPDNVGKGLREGNAIHLEPASDFDGKESSVSVGYEYKQYDVSGTEAYKRRIAEDIHKFSNTPNMNDENFASNTSGVAMKYKLFGLEQARASKETMLRKGMERRYKLIMNLKSGIGEVRDELNLMKLNIDFTPNFPEATEDELKAFVDAGGELSLETLLTTLSFIDDAKEEMTRIEVEKKESQDFTDEEKASFDSIRREMFEVGSQPDVEPQEATEQEI